MACRLKPSVPCRTARDAAPPFSSRRDQGPGVDSVDRPLGAMRTSFVVSGLFGLFSSLGLLVGGLYVRRIVLLSLLGMFFSTAQLYVGLAGRAALESNRAFVDRVVRGTAAFLTIVFALGLSMGSAAAVVDIGASVGLAMTWLLARQVRRYEHDGAAGAAPAVHHRLAHGVRRSAAAMRALAAATMSSQAGERVRAGSGEILRLVRQSARRYARLSHARPESLPTDEVNRSGAR